MIIYHCSSYRHHTCCASAIRRPAYRPDGRFSIKICSKLYHQHRRIMDTHGTSDATVGFSKINSKNPTITIPAGNRPGLRASRSRPATDQVCVHHDPGRQQTRPACVAIGQNDRSKKVHPLCCFQHQLMHR